MPDSPFRALARKAIRNEASRVPRLLERAFVPGNNLWAWYEVFKALSPSSSEEFQAGLLRNPKEYAPLFAKLGLQTQNQRINHLAWLFKSDPAIKEGWQEYSLAFGIKSAKIKTKTRDISA